MPETPSMVSLYDNQIEIKFTPKKHTYYRKINVEPVTYTDYPNEELVITNLKKEESEWIKIPSTTYYTGKCLDKPELYNWMVDTTARTFKECIAKGHTLLDAEVTAKAARFKAMKKGGDVGSAVHDWIHQFVKSELGELDHPELDMPKEIEHCIEGFLEWYEKFVDSPIETEYIVYHPGMDIVGTLDLTFMNKEGQLEIVDFKTGSNIYPADVMQIAFYRKAYTLQHGKYPDVASIVHLHKELVKTGRQYTVLNQLNHEANMIAFECGHYLVNWRDKTLKI